MVRARNYTTLESEGLIEKSDPALKDTSKCTVVTSQGNGLFGMAEGFVEPRWLPSLLQRADKPRRA